MLGFNAIESKIIDAHRHKKLHHAILLHGKKGIGKASFSKKLVLEILRSHNSTHPDLLLIEKEPGKKEIPVAKIRNIAGFLNQTSAISKDKFIIIDSADELNKSSSNALLKTLEEPHPNNFLILISHNPNKVMTTIKSRCQTIKAPDLSLHDFTHILQENNPSISRQEIEILSQICDNSPAKAIRDGQALISLYEMFLRSLHSQIIDDTLQKHIADKNFSFDIITQLVEFFLNRLVKFLNHIEIDFFFEEKDIFLTLKERFSLPTIFDISDKIRVSLDRNKALHLDKKLTFINIFGMLNSQ